MTVRPIGWPSSVAIVKEKVFVSRRTWTHQFGARRDRMSDPLLFPLPRFIALAIPLSSNRTNLTLLQSVPQTRLRLLHQLTGIPEPEPDFEDEYADDAKEEEEARRKRLKAKAA